MMANAVEMQQLLMSIDPSSANQFNMNKGGACVMTASSGGSASPTSSSGAPSSSSILADAEEKDQFLQSQLFQNGIGGNQLMQMILQQQQQQQKTNGNNGDLSSSIMDMFSNGNGDIAKLAAQLAQQNKSNENEVEDIEPSPSPPPAVSLNSTLAAMVLPTTSTSTGCSAASTTSSVDSAASSVIVNGHVAPQTSAGDDEEPIAKRVKTEEETPMPSTTNAQLMQFIAQMGLTGTLQQHTQKQMKDQEMMFGQMFNPQSLGLGPLMFPSALHQQFSGMQDFDSLSALSTPNKGSGVKRQYSSNGKNFCDICNKEVCNKYFLRTHMLKMHGIVIDENKTVIANIDTSIKERDGEVTFRCDTCRHPSITFKTRNELRQHRQDVHGVLPLSTPRNNANKPSVPSTPTGANNNSGPNSASLSDEKCQYCDKRFSTAMMPLHMVQDHMSQVAGANANGTPDLSHVLSMFNQASRMTKSEEKDMSSQLLDCSECSYKTRDPKNLDLHLERHIKMSEAKCRPDDDEDVALKLTTEVALQMVVQNQNQFDGDSAAALNLTFKNDGMKKDLEEEKGVGNQNHERNSHTSGSISPSGSIPEGFKILGEKPIATQSFLIRCNDECGEFLTEFLAQLPVRSQIDRPRKITFDLLPAPATN